MKKVFFSQTNTFRALRCFWVIQAECKIPKHHFGSDAPYSSPFIVKKTWFHSSVGPWFDWLQSCHVHRFYQPLYTLTKILIRVYHELHTARNTDCTIWLHNRCQNLIKTQTLADDVQCQKQFLSDSIQYLHAPLHQSQTAHINPMLQVPISLHGWCRPWCLFTWMSTLQIIVAIQVMPILTISEWAI